MVENLQDTTKNNKKNLSFSLPQHKRGWLFNLILSQFINIFFFSKIVFLFYVFKSHHSAELLGFANQHIYIYLEESYVFD